MSCTFRAEAPFFCEVTSQMAANHVLSGVRVRWKMVPAVTEVLRPQAAHFQCRVEVGHAFSPWHTGHRKPCGQRSSARYAAQLASSGNHSRNSW